MLAGKDWKDFQSCSSPFLVFPYLRSIPIIISGEEIVQGLQKGPGLLGHLRSD
jgi:hypothetical protein